jgi:hypothetical protein
VGVGDDGGLVAISAGLLAAVTTGLVRASVVRGSGGRVVVVGVSGLGDVGDESVVGIGGVVDGAGGSVGLQKAVVSLDDVTVAGLGLALLVAGVRVVHSVLK